MSTRDLMAGGMTGNQFIRQLSSAGFRTQVNATTVSLDRPNYSPGHVFVVIISAAATQNGTWSVPDGWSKVVDGGAPGTLLAYKKAGTSELAGFSFTYSRSTTFAGTIASYSGAEFVELLVRASSTGNNSGATLPATLHIRDNGLALAIFAVQNTGSDLPQPPNWETLFALTEGISPHVAAFTLTQETVDIPEVSVAYGTNTNAGNDRTLAYLTTAGSIGFSSYAQSTADALLNTVTVSPGFTVTGGAGEAVVTGGEFRINAGPWITSGPISIGNHLELRTVVSAFDTPQECILTAAGISHVWQITAPSALRFISPGTFSLVVPASVTTISALVLAGGGGGAAGRNIETSGYGGAGGGGLSYTNAIAVTPGETLTVTVGAGGAGGAYPGGPGTHAGDTLIARSGIDIVRAQGGRGRTSLSTAGAAGGASTIGLGAIRFNGGAGASTANVYGNGESGGMGGGAALPNAHGPNGVWHSSVPGTNIFVAGKSGPGTVFNISGWTSDGDTSAPTTGGGDGRPGLTSGGGGGSGWSFTNHTAGSSGGNGAPGAAIILFDGRIFSSANTY